ncbi:hypothetical protein F2P47_13875 [Parvibaculum sedimenti]|uniref:Tetratricopeptide repeat protein n=1 Tax=Parvibaculum sedimenti TaxID=2608632 RepID=A0A6N6VII5_9HYPH|nr:hypothetical protein [Parvibaculum sedimenti]KAB7739092.1 hypothetical protein F2P47_13875 [Parvibaculum sedimenti]
MRSIAAALLVVWSMIVAAPAGAAVNVSGNFIESDGYGRIVLTWPGGVPAHVEAITSGVLVVKFDQPFTTDLSEFMRQMPDYVAMARQDADGRTLRLALKFDYWLNVQQAESSLYLDLLPSSWAGKAPSLPADVLARIAAASAAKKKAAEDAKLVKDLGIVDPGAPAPALRVRVARHDGMTRLVFDWNQPVLYSVVQQEGAATVTFDRSAKVALAPIRVDPPPYLETISALERDGRLSIVMKLKPGVAVTDFREDLGVVLDLKPRAETEASEPVAEEPRVRADHEKSAAAVPAAQAHTPKRIVPTSEAPPAVEKHEAAETVKPEPEVPIAAAAPDAAGQMAPLKVSASAVDGRTDIIFPWTVPAGAAVFVRAGTLWVVFDRTAPLDLSALLRNASKQVGQPRSVEIENGVALAFPLGRSHVLVSAAESGTEWRVSVGETLAGTGRSINVERSWRDTGEGVVGFDMKDARRIVQIHDPVVGDVLEVATARAPVQSLQTPRSFVEFQALQTAQGLAIVQIADDLNVVAGPESVAVTRQSGLTLSADNSETPSQASFSYAGFMDFADWRGKKDYTEERKDLEAKIAMADAEDVAAARVTYARFLVANQLGPEAVAQLRQAEQADGGLSSDPGFAALKGVAKVLAHRYAEAVTDLSASTLAMDPNAAIWRGLARVELGQMAAARRDFDLASPAISSLEPQLAARVKLKAARAAVAMGNLQAARGYMRLLPDRSGDHAADAEVLLVKAQIAAALDQTDKAAVLYDDAIAQGVRRFAVQARLEKALMLNRAGKLNDKLLLAELEKLRMMWRGDDLELRILSALSERQLATGDVVAGLKTMRVATVNFPNSDDARAMGARMPDIFADYFINDSASKLPPIQALSLYYDFQDLTPIGRRGDDLLRHLAEHLASLDLLPQAETLLRYQIEQRLHSGVAKAQVAARLAGLYLLDRKPQDALNIIRATAQNGLPEDIDEQRRLIEARSLGSLKKFDLALDLLSEIPGPIAQVLRADILWEAQRWGDAGAAAEVVLAGAGGARPLTDDERFDVMRSAIAYAMAEDEEGLSRLRTQFGSRMAATSDASAFAVVTDAIEKNGVAFRELASRIASVNTMERFVNSLKKDDRVSELDGTAVAANE